MELILSKCEYLCYNKVCYVIETVKPGDPINGSGAFFTTKSLGRIGQDLIEGLCATIRYSHGAIIEPYPDDRTRFVYIEKSYAQDFEDFIEDYIRRINVSIVSAYDRLKSYLTVKHCGATNCDHECAKFAKLYNKGLRGLDRVVINQLCYFNSSYYDGIHLSNGHCAVVPITEDIKTEDAALTDKMFVAGDGLSLVALTHAQLIKFFPMARSIDFSACRIKGLQNTYCLFKALRLLIMPQSQGKEIED